MKMYDTRVKTIATFPIMKKKKNLIKLVNYIKLNTHILANLQLFHRSRYKMLRKQYDWIMSTFYKFRSFFLTISSYRDHFPSFVYLSFFTSILNGERPLVWFPIRDRRSPPFRVLLKSRLSDL